MRGLNAPPRRPTAPASLTAWAISSICVLLSTLHGPAMTPTFFPPTAGPPSLPTKRHDRSLFLDFPGGHLVWGQDRHDFFDAVDAFEGRRSLKRSSPMTATTVRSVPSDDVIFESHFAHQLDDMFDLFGSRTGFHDDDHREASTETENEKASGPRPEASVSN